MGAFGVGGPMAAVGVNQAFAAGASPLQVAMGIASQGGTGMEWLDSIGNILNNPAAQNILGLNKPAPAPAPVLQAAPSVTPSVQVQQGLSTTAMIAIGLGVVAVVLVGFFALKKK